MNPYIRDKSVAGNHLLVRLSKLNENLGVLKEEFEETYPGCILARVIKISTDLSAESKVSSIFTPPNL
jgi:hypothetical protein